MHFLYVGYYVDDSVFYEILNRKINNMSVARQKFEYNLLAHIGNHTEGDTVDYISYVPTKEGFAIPEYSTIGDAKIYHIPINKGKASSLYSAMRRFSQYLKNLGEDKLRGLRVIMYDVNPMFLIPLLRIRKKYDIKICMICAELPCLKRYKKKIQYELQHAVLWHFTQKFDGYILFAEAMTEKLKSKSKPYLVVEGIAPDLFGEPAPNKKNIMMYAGGFAADNNVRMMVDACLSLPQIDELWLCGGGADAAYVEEKAKQEPRIRYFGMVENDRVRQMETQAKLLLNVRNPEAELTKYSFPSKVLEYIASGSLVLSSRLGGIPEEYFEHLIALDEVNEACFVKVLEEIFSMDDERYVEKCKRAQAFISEHKNADVQASRIISFVKEQFPQKT